MYGFEPMRVTSCTNASRDGWTIETLKAMSGRIVGSAPVSRLAISQRP